MHYIFLPPSPASTHAHTPTLRNDFRQFLNVQSKEYWTQDNMRNPVMKLLLSRDLTIDLYSLDSIRQVRRKPVESLPRYGQYFICC